MVLNNDVKMINPYDGDNQNQADVSSAKYYM